MGKNKIHKHYATGAGERALLGKRLATQAGGTELDLHAKRQVQVPWGMSLKSELGLVETCGPLRLVGFSV